MDTNGLVTYRESALPQLILQYLRRMESILDSDSIRSLSFSGGNDLTTHVEDLLTEVGFEKTVIQVIQRMDDKYLTWKNHVGDITLYLSEQGERTYILSSEDLQYGNQTPCLYLIESDDLEMALENFGNADKKAPTKLESIVSSVLAGTPLGGMYGALCGMVIIAGMHLFGTPMDHTLPIVGGTIGAGIISFSISVYPTMRTGHNFLDGCVVAKGEQALYDAIKHAPVGYRVAQENEEIFQEEDAPSQSLNTNSTLP